MKKLLFSLILLLVPVTVFAIEGTVNLNCSPTSAFPGDAINCTIAGDVSDGSVTDFSGTVTLSDNLEFVSGAASEGWTGTSDKGIFSLKTSKSASDSFEIASFNIKLKSDATTNGTVTLKTTKFGDIKNVADQTKNINLSTSTNEVDTSNGTLDQEDTSGDVKNPDTGSNIPFIIIGSCSLGAIIVYEVVTRKKKLHKI